MVGKRTQESADLLLERLKDVTDGHVPFFTSDQWPGYEEALLRAYGHWVQPERRGQRGRFPHPRRVAAAGLLYAQVDKVIPLATQHYTLLQRNLLYTAVTRGRRLVVLIAQPHALAMAVKQTGAGRAAD